MDKQMEFRWNVNPLAVGLESIAGRHKFSLQLTMIPNDEEMLELRNIPGLSFELPRATYRYLAATVGVVVALKKLEAFNLSWDKNAELKAKMLLAREALGELRARKSAAYVYKDEAPDIKFITKHEPYKHQRVAYGLVQHPFSFALLMDMGTGKTKVCIDKMCNDVFKAKEQRRVLVVCPRTVLDTWQVELEKHATVPYVAVRLRGGKRKRIAAITNGLATARQDKTHLFIVLVNYESVVSLLPIFQKLKFHLVVADESSRMKNMSTARTKAMLDLREHSGHRIILSGQPITRNVMDLYSQFEFLEAGCLGFDTMGQFRANYAITNGPWNKVIGVRNEEELMRRLSRYAFIVKKSQCLDLPAKTYTMHSVELSKEQVVVYNDVATKALAELEAISASGKQVTATMILVRLLRLAQVTSGFVGTDDKENVRFKKSPKADALMELLDDILPEQKIVVWCRFVDNIEDLAARVCKQFGHGVVEMMYGKTKDRDRVVNRFNNDDECMVMIAQPQTGGLGITLLGSKRRPVGTVVYYSQGYNLEERVQSEDRCHRIGMHRPVTYIDLAADGSVDSHITSRLAQKLGLAESLTDAEEMFKSIKEEEEN